MIWVESWTRVQKVAPVKVVGPQLKAVPLLDCSVIVSTLGLTD